MTIEEASFILANIDRRVCDDELSEALDMAISALEQEPCEDAVSRQAVLDYLDKMPSELTSDGRIMIRRRTLEEYISDTLSPVTPQQKSRCDKCVMNGSGSKYCDNCTPYNKGFDEGLEQGFRAIGAEVRQMGKWIIIDDCERFIAKCSECGRIEDSRMINKYPYCHCGAKMVESQGSEDKYE